MLDFFPKYFTSKAMLLYVIALILVSLIFFKYSLPFMFIFFGFLEVFGFFFFSNRLTKKWQNLTSKIFVKRLIISSFIIRVIWVIVSYYLYIEWTGQPFEWVTGDAYDYHQLGIWYSALLKEGNTSVFFDHFKGVYSDTGYPTYLGLLYFVFGNSIIVARLFKALFGALTVYLVYKIARRNFDESTARMAGVFAMLMPNLIFYTGLHLKEVEMLFLSTWFVERADALIREHKFSFNTLWLPVLLGLLLFFFRTVLGVTAVFAVFSALFLSSERSVKLSKRIIAAVWFSVAAVYFIGTQYVDEINSIWQQRETSQSTSMQWRAVRADNYNRYAQYASTAVFAPMIFVIPFSSMVYVPNQENQMIMNGSNFVKNILAFFLIYGLYWMIKQKKWRDYLLIVSFLVGYLAIISMSSFAHSERFHQPALPIYMVLTAFGVSKLTNKQKKYFNIYLVFLLSASIAWGWFKLSGRGLI